jgi:hydroxyethylthiazole kinase-like uncharacterized protein yjeF
VTARPDGVEEFGDLISEQVARLDSAALECGVTTLQLMEIAGWQVARCAWQHIGSRPGAITVVAGHGNNGGDGLVAARYLATWGCSLQVVVVAGELRVAGLVRDHIVAARRCGVDVTLSAEAGAAQSAIAGAMLVIDAILGTGLQQAPRELQAGAIRALNAGKAPVLSVDIPSGLDATTGEAFDPCVRATLTCTLTAMKHGLWTGEGAAQAGELWVADIGMPATAWERVGLRRPTGVTGGELVHTSSASPP